MSLQNGPIGGWVRSMDHPFELPSGPVAPRASQRSAIGKVLAVLEHLASSSRSVSVGELAKALDLSRSQAHRVVAMLEQEEMLIRHPVTKRIMFGTRFARVACRLLAGSPVKPLWHVVLDGLVNDIGATCNIVVYEGSIGTYFDRIEANWPGSLRLKFGSKVPLHCTAGGKLYLASLSGEERRIVVDSLTLLSVTDKTITDRTVLMHQLDAIEAEQVGVDDEEFVTGMVAIAVPVQASSGALLATLAMHALSPPMSIEKARQNISRLREASKHLADIFESHASNGVPTRRQAS
jgi:IclR family acetate operon transcriptional repressor